MRHILIVSLLLVSSIAYAEQYKFNPFTNKMDITNNKASEIGVTDNSGYYGSAGYASPPTVQSALMEIGAGIVGGGSVSDAAYGAGWNGDTTVAPSKNAVYDKIETLGAGSGDPILIDGTAVTDGSGVDLQGGAGIDITFNAAVSPDTAIFIADLTELNTATFGAGTFTTLTFDAGVTDPVITASSGDLAVSTGTFTLLNTGLHLLDTNASHDLIIKPGSDITADKTLTITTGDADRTVTINADSTISGSNSGDQTITLTGDVTGSGTGSFAATIATGAVAADELASTAVVAGSYTATDLTVDADGRITAASSGAGGSGDITSVGDVASGAAFDGTQGTTLTFNNAGGDKTLDYDGTDFLFNAPLSVDATDGADAGAIRLDNAENIAWEASPAGTDMTLGVDASEVLQYSGSFNATSLTENGNAVFNSAEVPGGELGGTWASPTLDDSVTVTGWVMGASTATTPAADDNDTSLATTAYVQGEIMKNYYWTLLPQGAVLDDNNPPAISVVESTGTGTSRRYVADFDASTDEIVYWSFVLPADYSGGNITATVLWFSNDTGANETCFWETQLSATTEGDADSMTEDAGATVNTASEDVPTAEANRLISTAVTISNLDSAAAGDFVTLRFARDANNGSDDLSSDARLLAIRLTIPRS